MKKILILFILSFLSIGCWYENDNISFFIFPTSTEENLNAIVFIKEKEQLNNTKFKLIQYDIYSNENIFSYSANIGMINNPTNIFDKNYMVGISSCHITNNHAAFFKTNTNKYLNLTIEEIDENIIIMRDWNNKNHKLVNIGMYYNYSTNWSHLLFTLLSLNQMYLNQDKIYYSKEEINALLKVSDYIFNH